MSDRDEEGAFADVLGLALASLALLAVLFAIVATYH